MSLSDHDLAAVIKTAGWTGTDAEKAFAISLAESGGEPTQTGRLDPDDLGLFQINRRFHPEVDRINWRDPYANAQLAHQIWSADGWYPWITYRTGAYFRYIGRARAALPAAQAGSIPLQPAPGNVSTNAFSSVLDFLRLVNDPHTWVRIGTVIAGIFLVAFGAFHFARPAIDAAAKAAGTATKIAAVAA